MKNLQPNLLIILALGLCALCSFQWYGQAGQRRTIQGMNELLYQETVAIQRYTNSIKSSDAQIAQSDARIAELIRAAKINDLTLLSQRHELEQRRSEIEKLNAALGDYKTAVGELEAKLKAAYEGIRQQNDSIQSLAAQRADFVQKVNACMKDRNDVVAKYNELVERVQKAQVNAKP